ncbi:SRPBCC family protein [Streptomyces sp. NPDC021080]|uniref:SRPBCC family protein n=1 Tax=Streptomyces sp. NPDC021080 TaxID=3365110 RepID=UPI0037B8B9D9
MKGSYDVTAESEAPASAVWSLLLDAHSWPRWGTVDALVQDRSENLSPNGRDEVGAVRAFRTGEVVTSERITQLRPCELFAYEDSDNPFMENYRARVTLEEKGAGGVRIRWRGDYDATPDVHPLLAPELTRIMQRMVTGLAEAAERAL